MPSPAVPPSPSSTHRLSNSSSSLKALPQPRSRSSSNASTTTTFAFQPLLLSQSDASYPPTSAHAPPPVRHLTLVSSISLVVGMQVGSGIFSSPGVIIAATGSVGASLTTWLVAGVLAWSGAASFAELGTAIPLDGGIQVYLNYAYGPLASYLFVWTSIAALKPGAAAIIALIFGEYINRLIYHLLNPLTAEDVLLVPEWSIKLTASIAVIVICLLNVLSPKAGSQAQVFLTGIKMISLVAIILLGLVTLIRSGPGEALSSGIWRGTNTDPSGWAIALYSGLWSYDGWDQSNYVAGSLINPTRDLPLTIHLSMISVITLFFLTNIAYFIVLPAATVALSNTVALEFGRAVMGDGGAVVASLVVGISCFGALNGGVYTTAKLIVSSSTSSLLPSIFSHLSPTRSTPDNAMLLQAATTLGFILAGGGFRSLINFFSVGNWVFLFSTVMGLLVLRVKEPGLERPYRTFLITPITFCAVALFLLFMPIFAAPLEAAAAFAFILMGVPAYYLTARKRDGQQRSSPPGYLTIVKEAGGAMWGDLRGALPRWLGGTGVKPPEEAGYGRLEMTER